VIFLYFFGAALRLEGAYERAMSTFFGLRADATLGYLYKDKNFLTISI
jgi:hypothetical protein